MSQVRILPGALRSPRATHATLFRGPGLDCPSPRDGPPAREGDRVGGPAFGSRPEDACARGCRIGRGTAVRGRSSHPASRRRRSKPKHQATTKAPKGLKFYKPPKASPQAPRNPDLGAQGSTGIVRPGRTRSTRSWSSTPRARRRGAKDAISGSVSVPKGKPPKGGWPVITWAHGTTGVADICAPSRDGAGPVGQHGGELHQRRAERVAPRRLRGSAHGLRGSRDPRPAPLSDRDLGGPQRPRHRAGLSPAGPEDLGSAT